METEETRRWLDDTADTDAYIEKMVAAMKHFKVSQAQIARAAHVSPSTVSQIINHERRHLHIGRVPKWMWRETAHMVTTHAAIVAAKLEIKENER